MIGRRRLKSNKELGLGADTRSLGVSINELQLTP